MPANCFNNFTDYGIGIGLRAPHYDHILTRTPVVDWFEIISENFMIGDGRPLYILDRILEQYKVVQHGVSMYFGSAEKLNREHLRRLKERARNRRMKPLNLRRQITRSLIQPLTPSDQMHRVAPEGRTLRIYAERFIERSDGRMSIEHLDICSRRHGFRIACHLGSALIRVAPTSRTHSALSGHSAQGPQIDL